ncbi:MAG: response regulator transcription factor [Deltaproteobacteria bacterium]|nr:response regulator transcription factor [Deltaproteobacteria bacterium]
MQADPIVFVVDDDSSVCQSLTWLIESVGIKVETFPSAAEFLKRHPHDGPACLLLDVRMPGLSGFDLQNQLATAGRVIPIIFITGHGSVSMSVRAMKAGAVDFIEKPFEDQTLLDVLSQSLEKDRQAKREQAEKREIKQRVDSLTTREHEVFKRVVAGKLNKQIAFELGTTERTIKAHRARVMQKIQVHSLADLVRLAVKAGIGLKK